MALVPEDIQAIISGIVANQDLVGAVADKLRKTLNPPILPSLPISNLLTGRSLTDNPVLSSSLLRAGASNLRVLRPSVQLSQTAKVPVQPEANPRYD